MKRDQPTSIVILFLQSPLGKGKMAVGVIGIVEHSVIVSILCWIWLMLDVGVF
jgi:hypothetical protein